MIVKTTKEINGVEYDYTYSDMGMMIERNGAQYAEAFDPIGLNREYTETDIPVETESFNSEIEEKAAAYDILMGVRE